MSDFSEWLSIDPRTFPESSKYIEEPFFLKITFLNYVIHLDHHTYGN